MTSRAVAVIVGVAVFVAALLEMTVVGVLPVPLGQEVIYAVGGLLLVYALFVLEAKDEARFTQVDTADPELPICSPTPGEDFWQTLAQFQERKPRLLLTDARAGLRAAASTVLTRYGGCSEGEARRQLEAGTWTDDPVAAAFLREAEPRPRSVSSRLRARLFSDMTYRRDRRRTVDAIAAVAGVGPPRRDERHGNQPRGRWPVATRGARTASEPTEVDPSGIEVESRGVNRRATNHWAGISAVAVIGLGVGLLLQEPAILLSGTVGLGYAAYARSSPLGPVQVAVDRSFSDDAPQPGDAVEVTVTVRNEGGALADVRVVDGVPPALAVTDGSPRLGTALRRGESTSFAYTVTARRGRHPFQPAHVIVRNLPTTTEQEQAIEAATGSELVCIPTLRPTMVGVPLRPQVTRYAGGGETTAGGAGVEFFATRQFQAGDALNRVDWHRLARTGELATIEFRQERAAEVVLGIDVQPSAYVAHAPYEPHAVDWAVAAAQRLFARLLDDGHHVGLATVGGADCWLPPGTGSVQRFRGQHMLATDPAFTPVPRASNGPAQSWERRLDRQLPPAAQLIVLSPLTDVATVRSIRQFEAAGHPVTVFSPDVTADRTVGHRLLRVRRNVSVTDLRGAGIPVVEWTPTPSASDALDEALVRRRRVGAG